MAGNRSNGSALFKFAFVGLVVMVAWLTWRNVAGNFGGGDASKALGVVKQFYRYEQAGDFGSSWELFHPLMQERFDKADYIQKRAHIILQDFGVKTFRVTIGAPKKVSNWQMSTDAQPIAHVYELDVTQTFHSPYGDFEIRQPSFAANVDGKWKLLWSYQAGGI